MPENTNGELTPKEIREQNIQFCKDNWHDVPANISKAKLEKLVAELKENSDDTSKDDSDSSEENTNGELTPWVEDNSSENDVNEEDDDEEDEEISEWEVEVTPKTDIAWGNVEWGIMKSWETYVISSEDYKRIKHLVRKA